MSKKGAQQALSKNIYIYILLNLYILIYFRAPGKGTTKAGDTFSNSFPVVPLHIKVRNGDCDGGMELGRRPGLSCCGKLTAKLRYIFVLAMFVYDLLFQFPFEPRLSNYIYITHPYPSPLGRSMMTIRSCSGDHRVARSVGALSFFRSFDGTNIN